MFVLTGDQIDPNIKTNILKVPENYDNLVIVLNKRRPDQFTKNVRNRNSEQKEMKSIWVITVLVIIHSRLTAIS